MTLTVFPPLADIEAALAAPGSVQLEPLRLAVLREITVEPIDTYLRCLARRSHMEASVAFGGVSRLVEETVGGAAYLTGDLDAVLVFAPLAALSPVLSCGLAGMGRHDLRTELDRIETLFHSVLAGIRRQTDAMILWHGLEPPLYPTFGILDVQRPDGQTAAVAALNAALRAAAGAVAGAYVVDMAACLARVGGAHFYDPRYWHLARAPYTPRALAEIAAEDFRFIRALRGKAKKCLVLDADQTLWGGVIGEEGLSGIRLGGAYPGSAFVEFQQEVVSLFHRGVLIALCSRNNDADVWEVFDHHPDMVLRREHIAAWRINWRDKATNLRELSEELNIGLESMVLADDSEFEAGLVRDQLPDVAILQLPAGEPVEYRRSLAACGHFDVLAITDEDRTRSTMYAAEAARRRARSDVVDLGSYYRSLGMTLEIGRADEFSIPRIAQLTQKTNQFNLTTRRYGEADILRFVRSADHEVLWVRVTDRIGDLGIVGACVLAYAGRRASIDTFLLSCRALGRGVERRFLVEALHLSRARGAEVVQGEYIRTAKNAQTETFFLDNGFAEVERAAGADVRTFELQLERVPPRELGHFAGVSSPLAIPVG
ncbi:MAG: hypothetical protein A3I61_19945 [Acidobacteria bacterium RIFCSPLOWO2_02_FULL_68_18]|nr:MAG: hypothetical protein A3I61_19945 [Acidobacteria bacterium RIFCSPLOWO2_02_FULL_68_18]OFW48264.1 MAG: hypothetical protein A3G77_03195 [Acidobacteria bacterium RIFCSPLOWO2_12_FULL_68_19]